MGLLGYLLLGVLVVQDARAAPSPVASTLQDEDPMMDQVRAEILAWKAAGHASIIHFLDDARKPAVAYVGGDLSAGNRPYVPNDDDVKFHVFTKRNESDVEGARVSLDKESFLAAGWDSNRPAKVVIHGFTNTIASAVIQDIKNAYLGRGSYNVVGVDWGALCESPNYVTARLHVGFAATRVAALLRLLLSAGLADPPRLHLLGHSLGAHVAGLAAQELRNGTGVRPGRITGLDPAWPLFMLSAPDARLSEEQADTVDVIHTCAGYLGFPSAIGTADFFPNGGGIGQPGCGVDALGFCSHDRSFQYFVESVAQGAGFQADSCADDKAARRGDCSPGGPGHDGCMGDEIYNNERGSYYLKTSDDAAASECQRSNRPAAATAAAPGIGA